MESKMECEILGATESVGAKDKFRGTWLDLREEFIQLCNEVGGQVDLKKWLARSVALGTRQLLDVYREALRYEESIGCEGMRAIWTQKQEHVRCVDGFIGYEVVLVGPRDLR